MQLEYGLTPIKCHQEILLLDIMRAISENIEKPAGRLDSNTRELELQMTSKLSDINSLKI